MTIVNEMRLPDGAFLRGDTDRTDPASDCSKRESTSNCAAEESTQS
jgi:hypothetical protein